MMYVEVYVITLQKQKPHIEWGLHVYLGGDERRLRRGKINNLLSHIANRYISLKVVGGNIWGEI